MDQTTPFFSIIIPTHNRAAHLKLAIESVVDQSFQNWELLIIDDGSTDQTKSVVSQFSNPKLSYFYQENQERSTARNRGIDEAQGLYICFLDDDDYFLPNHLSSFFEEIERRSYPIGVLRSGYYKKINNKLLESPLYNPSIHQNPVKFAALNFTGVWSMCFHRNCLKEDRFPIQFRHWQDTHLILRVLAKYPFYQLNIYSYVYQIHPQMGSKTIYDFEDAQERIESNVAAIRHLFCYYNELVASFLPDHTEAFLVSKKYLDHAEGAMLDKHFILAMKLYAKSIRHNKRGWLFRRSFFFPLKIALKFTIGIPNPPNLNH
ncbi:MAG: glycosyltransferase family 2 protein [Saprospiraceae bacterium]